MVLAQNAELLVDRNGTTSRLAAGADSIPIEDHDWRKCFSAPGEYQPQDRFDEDVFSQIEQRLASTNIVLLFRIGVTAIVIVAALVALYFLFFDPGQFPLRFWNLDPKRFVVTSIEYWLNQSSLTMGTKFVVSGLAMIAVFFLGSVSLTSKLWAESREYLRSIKELRRQTHDSKQIYPGSGGIQFSYGNQGFLISANTLSLKISWHRVAPPDSLMYLLVARRDVGSGRRRIVRLEIIDEPHGATHLMLFLRSNTVMEYLVVPKRFFDDENNAIPWTDFVRDLSKFRRQFAGTKT